MYWVALSTTLLLQSALVALWSKITFLTLSVSGPPPPVANLHSRLRSLMGVAINGVAGFGFKVSACVGRDVWVVDGPHLIEFKVSACEGRDTWRGGEPHSIIMVGFALLSLLFPCLFRRLRVLWERGLHALALFSAAGGGRRLAIVVFLGGPGMNVLS